MFDPATLKLNVDPLILSALREDITSDDMSTNSVMPQPEPGTVNLIAKEDGILCGVQVFQRTFELLDPTIDVAWNKQDGDHIANGIHVATVQGDIRVLLSGERTALNYLQHMSGIATYMHRMVEKLKGTGIRLLDTRKTTPNNRIFEKYAVRVGGGYSHRYNLSDGIMLKDNHIDAAGGIRQAVAAARDYAPFVHKIEVETENLEMVKEALDAGADIIMLDNMSHAQMAEAVRVIAGHAEIEASGNVTLDNLDRYSDLDIDYVSCGALTHSAPILDLSLKHLRQKNRERR